jgi:hypothetical protein
MGTLGLLPTWFEFHDGNFEESRNVWVLLKALRSHRKYSVIFPGGSPSGRTDAMSWLSYKSGELFANYTYIARTQHKTCGAEAPRKGARSYMGAFGGGAGLGSHQ